MVHVAYGIHMKVATLQITLLLIANTHVQGSGVAAAVHAFLLSRHLSGWQLKLGGVGVFVHACDARMTKNSAPSSFAVRATSHETVCTCLVPPAPLSPKWVICYLVDISSCAIAISTCFSTALGQVFGCTAMRLDTDSLTPVGHLSCKTRQTLLSSEVHQQPFQRIRGQRHLEQNAVEFKVHNVFETDKDN